MSMIKRMPGQPPTLENPPSPEPTEPSSLDAILSERFDINISPDTLAQLKQTEEREDRAEILQEIFPEARREEMLQMASEDSKGRKVKYYRFIRWDKFMKLLENKKLTAMDYFNLDEKVDEKELFYFFIDYADFLKVLDRFEEDYKALSWSELMSRVFPTLTPQETQSFLNDLSFRNILPFVQKNVDPLYMRRRHTGSVGQKFSSLLSLSVGGITTDHLGKNTVYLEMVMPDDKITPHPEGVEGEKEVFTDEINLYNVARVYDSVQIWDDIIMNPDTIIGAYQAKIDYSKGSHSPAVEQWRWGERTNDYLPTSLAKQGEQVES